MFMIVRNSVVGRIWTLRIPKLSSITLQTRSLLDSFFYDIYVLLYIVIIYIIITKIQKIYILIIILLVVMVDLVIRTIMDINIMVARSSGFRNRIRNRLYYILKTDNTSVDLMISNLLIFLIMIISFIIIVVMIGLSLYELQQLIITTTGYIYSNKDYLLYSQNSLSLSTPTINRLRSMLAGLLQNVS